MSREEVPYRVLESKISLMQHDADPNQWKWLLSCLFYGVGFIFIPAVGYLSIPFFIVGPLGWFRYSSGPGYYIALQLVKNLHTKWRRAHPSKKPKLAKKAPIEVGLMALPLTADQEEIKYRLENDLPIDIGSAYHPPRDSDATMVVASGWNAANMDPEELIEREDWLGESVIDIAKNAMQPIGYTIGLSTRPYNAERARQVDAENAHLKIKAAHYGMTLEDVLREGVSNYTEIDQRAIHSDGPGNQAVDKMLALHYAEVQARKKSNVRDVTAFYGLNIPRPIYWPSTENGDLRPLIKNKQLTEEVIAKSPIVTLTQKLADNLTYNGVKSVHVLTLDELKTFTRVAWDIKTVENWHRGLTVAPDGTPLNPAWPWPLTKPLTGVDSDGKEYFVLDGTFHRIYRMFGLNKRRIYPGEFASLFVGDNIGPADQTGLVVTLSADSILTRSEVRRTTRAIRYKKAARLLTDSQSRDYSALEMEESDRLIRRRDALEAGGSHALNHNTFAVASATSLALLNGIDKEIERKALDLSVTLHVIPWESRLNAAFWTATLGTGMM